MLGRLGQAPEHHVNGRQSLPKGAMGGYFSAKTFRTWIATLLAMILFAERAPGASRAEQVRQHSRLLV
jgi:hypothetical protein